MKKKFEKGITIFEVLTVCGLIALIVATMMPALSNMLYAYHVSTAARQMTANIRFARNAAVKQKAGYKIVINDSGSGNPNTYLIQNDVDNDGSYTDFTKLDSSIPSSVTIDPTSIDEVEFDHRGSASPIGEVLLIGKKGDRYKLTIGLAGSVVMTKT